MPIGFCWRDEGLWRRWIGGSPVGIRPAMGGGMTDYGWVCIVGLHLFYTVNLLEGGKRAQDLRVIDHDTQFSNHKPSTRENSEALLVTSVTFRDKSWVAIRVSRAPVAA